MQGFCCSCNGLPHQDTEPRSSDGSGVALLAPGLISRHVKRSTRPGVRNREIEKEKKNSIIPLKSLPCSPFRHNQRLGRPPVFFFENDKALMGGSPGEDLCSGGSETQSSNNGDSILKKHKGQLYGTERGREIDMTRLPLSQDNYNTRTSGVHMKHTRKPKKITNVLLFEDEYKYLNPDTVEVDQRARRSSPIKTQPDTLRARIDKERMRKVLDVNKGRYRRKERHSCTAGSEEGPTAHCLRFSDLWYSAYTFKDPIIIQELTIQAFQKRDAVDGTTYWADLTRGSVIRCGE